jgi:hypothetical protein
MDLGLPHSIGISQILINYLIPIVLFSFAIKEMLEKIRIFGYHSVVNWGISISIAILTVYFLPGFSLYFTGVSILAICLFKIEGGKKFLIGIAATAIYFIFIMPYLSSLG